MTVDAALGKRLLEELPDIPRWLETRGPLLSGDCEVLGFVEEPLAFVVVDRPMRLASIGGEPAAEVIREAVEQVGESGDVLAQEDNREYVERALPGWRAETAHLHLLADESALAKAVPGSEVPRRHPGRVVLFRPDVRVVTYASLARAEGLSAELREELERALLRWTVVAAHTEFGQLASFCYAAWPTESLWDVAVETLAPHRRQGHAAMSVKFLVDHMWQQRKRPVWGALESNAASLALAKRLGFRPVDTLVVMHPPGYSPG
ncbi:MAG TPA: GNAT family N-acetyltransferase [Dehalococcoidia bacterium]